MKIYIKSLSICTILLLAGCNAQVSTQITKSYPATSSDQNISVLQREDTPPENSEYIGMVEVGDNGLTGNSKCTYEAVVELAKEEARKAGGNAIRITKHKTPDLISTCHQITADILRIENVDSHLYGMAPKQKTDTNFAVLNIFRDDAKLIADYDLYIGKSLLCHVSNKFKKTVLVKADEPTILWAETEKKEELEVDLKPGHVYHLRCDVGPGIAVGRPLLFITESNALSAQFEALEPKKAEAQDTIILEKGGTAIRYTAASAASTGDSQQVGNMVAGERLATYEETKRKRFIVSLDGGYSRRLAKISEETPTMLMDHMKSIKNGFNLGGDLTFLFNNFIGAGAKFSMFHTYDEKTIPMSYGHPDHNIKDKYIIPIIGPMFALRQPINEKNHLLSNYSIGYMGYTNEGEFDGQWYRLKGKTVYASIDLGYDHWFSSGMGIGFKLSLVGGTLSEYTKEDGVTKQEVELDKDHYEGLGRIDFSVGLRFGK